MATPPWLPYPIVLACSDDCRSPECLREVVKQFDVEIDDRYKPNLFDCPGTRCNFLGWDFTRAMECEVPHWVDNNGQSVRHHSPGSHELSANGMIEWLRVYGGEHGWQRVSLPEARGLANQGRPVLVCWENPQCTPEGKRALGHIAVMLPTPEGMAEPRIAQAGATNFFDRPLSHGFGHLKPEFWCHD